MFASGEYQLLDFGAGRKLERFGPYVLDRPAPGAAEAAPRKFELWPDADATYERGGAQQGRWHFNRLLDESWPVRHGELTLILKFTDSGQVGLFPEQAKNWDWIAEQVRSAGRPLQVLNLFAYTGGSTLAAAAAGAEVVHVDAATSVVAWARANAEASGLADAPIRWIAEDAVKFARRELKRGHRYDAVILDPPGYGHGPRGETWKLEQHLGELLGVCLELTAENRQFILLTCHSGVLATAAGLLKATLEHAGELRNEGSLESRDVVLASAAGGQLPCGSGVRFTNSFLSRRPAASSVEPERAGVREPGKPAPTQAKPTPDVL